MKKLLPILLLCACHTGPTIFDKPEIVHNPCNGRWAVRTGVTEKSTSFYLGCKVRYTWFADTMIIDTTNRAYGPDLNFPDSLAAASCMDRFDQREQAAIRAKAAKDSMMARRKKREDSIQKCDNNYN